MHFSQGQSSRNSSTGCGLPQWTHLPGSSVVVSALASCFSAMSVNILSHVISCAVTLRASSTHPDSNLTTSNVLPSAGTYSRSVGRISVPLANTNVQTVTVNT